ncbi:VOC family protein [Pseudotenacibaculum sp. MALMAid0570]|uniref:VOC family protein n=1 Tax=Pseudotenacibaculum sp. MALMAid0570 TaxID=3143938 RepID=UPI0032DE9ECD
MIQNKFIWADLSSYSPNKTKRFYEEVFNWKYYDNNYYLTAYKGNQEVVGLYQTPEMFQKMKMPSFWMSYIQVESVVETVNKAKELGGVIELIDLKNPIGGVALIRDNLGAGFTIYEGNSLNSRTKSEPNTLIYNELQVSNIEKAVEFYQKLFSWKVEWNSKFSVTIYCNKTNEEIASIRQLDDSIRGKYEYWVCTFGVENLDKTINKIKKNQGIIVFNEDDKIMCSDGSEAFFYIQEI